MLPESSLLSRRIGEIFMNLPAEVQPGAGSPEFMVEFRLGAVERDRGNSMQYADAFLEMLDAQAPVGHLHAAFITATTVLGNSVKRLRNAGILSNLSADSAERLLARLRREAADDPKIEVIGALAKIDDGLDRADQIPAYKDFAKRSRETRENLLWVKDFIAETVAAHAEVRELDNRAATAQPTLQ